MSGPGGRHDFLKMGLISYHRAGVAKRRAGIVFEFAHVIAATVQELASRHELLEDIVHDHEAAIDELRGELDELRRRVDKLTPAS